MYAGSGSVRSIGDRQCSVNGERSGEGHPGGQGFSRAGQTQTTARRNGATHTNTVFIPYLVVACQELMSTARISFISQATKWTNWRNVYRTVWLTLCVFVAQLEKCSQDLGNSTKAVSSAIAQLLSEATQGNENYTGVLNINTSRATERQMSAICFDSPMFCHKRYESFLQTTATRMLQKIKYLASCKNNQINE